MFLAIIIFIVPLCTGLYLWRKDEPPKKIYVISFIVSLISMGMLILGINSLMTLMGVGLFLAATSFFAGTFLSVLVRAYYTNKSAD